MATISDIKEGGLRFDSSASSCTRIFLVTDLTGQSHQILFNASQASGIPRRGDPHPSIPGMIATTVDIAPEGAGAKVTVEYTYPAFDRKEPDETAKPVISVGSTVQESTTSRNNKGELIKVKFKYKPVDEDGNIGEEITEDYVPVLSVQTGQTAIEYQRREPRSPLQKSLKYVGKVNNVLINGFPARTLLCTGIEGQSEDGGASYSVSYRFQYNPDTWDAEFFYIDQETGQPHTDVTVTPPNGYGVAQVYPEIDFSPLNVI